MRLQPTRGIGVRSPAPLRSLSTRSRQEPADHLCYPRNLPTDTTAMTGITIDHQHIRTWAESRGARPVMDNEEGQLPSPAISFSQENNGNEVSWDEWLRCFENGRWAFIWQDRTADGQLSRFWKLVPRFTSRDPREEGKDEPASA